MPSNVYALIFTLFFGRWVQCWLIPCLRLLVVAALVWYALNDIYPALQNQLVCELKVWIQLPEFIQIPLAGCCCRLSLPLDQEFMATLSHSTLHYNKNLL
jgi:hypothetical protein